MCLYIHTCISFQFSTNKWGSPSKEVGLTGEVTWTDALALVLKNFILKCSHLYKKSICTICTPPPQSIILEILEIQHSDPGKRYPHSKRSWTGHHGSILPHWDFWTPILNKIKPNEHISRPPEPGGRATQMVQHHSQEVTLRESQQ